MGSATLLDMVVRRNEPRWRASHKYPSYMVLPGSQPDDLRALPSVSIENPVLHMVLQHSRFSHPDPVGLVHGLLLRNSRDGLETWLHGQRAAIQVERNMARILHRADHHMVCPQHIIHEEPVQETTRR